MNVRPGNGVNEAAARRTKESAVVVQLPLQRLSIAAYFQQDRASCEVLAAATEG